MKLIVPAFLAVLINLFLFWLMQQMSVEENIKLNDRLNAEVIDFIRNESLSEPPPPPRREPPPAPEAPPQALQPETFEPMRTTKPSPMPMDALKLDSVPTTLELDGPYIGPVLKEGIGLMRGEDLRPIYRMAPRYPRSLKRRKIEGEVTVEFTLNVAGLVESPVITHSVPEGLFDNAALKAVKKWKFHPQLDDGKPVAVRVTQRIVFKLDR